MTSRAPAPTPTRRPPVARTLEVLAATSDHIFTCGVVSRRAFASAWIWAADLGDGRTIHEARLPIVAPDRCRVHAMTEPGMVAALVQPEARTIVTWRDHGTIEVIAQWARLSTELRLRLDPTVGAAAWVPPDEPPDAPPSAQLLMPMACFGRVRAALRRVDFDGGWAALRFGTDADERPGARFVVGVGADADGRGLALSVATPHGRASLWRGPTERRLARPTIYADALRPRAPWHVTTADGALDLVFTPRAQREGSLMPPALEQLAGRFDGAVRDPDGGRDEIAGLPGFGTLGGP